MEIKIWSDIRCPFCYIGKRKFEAALSNFEHKDKISIKWKSFELDPSLQTSPDIKAITHFCISKGVDEERAALMFDHAIAMGKEVGLELNFEHAVVANSLKAHRLLKFSESRGVSTDMKETLLNAHFVEGLNIDDVEVLCKLAHSLGLKSEEVKAMLLSEDYVYEVEQDGMEARNLGVNGVPFFVFDNAYGVSGAQPTAVFMETLEKAWEKHTEAYSGPIMEAGDSCKVGGECL